MIVRVTFNNSLIMLFGDSYKPWYMQFEEYVRSFKNELPPKPLKIEISKSKWIRWGGLKWCSDENFQNELNREGCQSEEPCNSKARQYSEISFYEYKNITNKALKIMTSNIKVS